MDPIVKTITDKLYGSDEPEPERHEYPGLTIYPVGANPDDDPHGNTHGFAVQIIWRGKGKWSVENGGSSLSHTGRWLYMPMKMHRQHVRHDYETAVRLARGAVDDVTVNGRTWKQWQEHFATLPPRP